ncbi:helix-turn-helix transcriptional regulator [Novosphingobium flavum]|uniref:Helix-turn-helix transcriptional regulator n=1 Tax=Novosphingobium flavum TaxID=1778672 RepID=A0A7X1FPK0_9SPHN|nr:helix-turn-helix transcriptional regulator [Novosphingobium flavum]MBC2664591.1 helix-turn-helix transcriptional regulator [Novosphingobium flavum]
MRGPDNVDWNDLFLSAALQPEQWPEALDAMARHTGSARGQLIGIGGDRDIPFNIVTHFAPPAFEEFLRIGGASPSVNFRIAACNRDIARGRYDSLLHEKHYDAVMPQLEDRRYADWCEEQGIPFGCQTNLVVDRLGLVGLAVLRTRRDGRTTPAQRRTFAAAADAARRAVRLQERLEGEQARFLAGAFDVIAATAFILDSRGRVAALTAKAEALVASGAVGLRQGQLEGEASPLSLGQATAALTGAEGLQHLRLKIDGGDERPGLFLEGFRLPRRDWSFGHLPHAILLVKQPQRDRAGISAFLSALYRLTTAEAEIAMRLFDGKGRAELCAERGVTPETLRGQIKSICAKTGSENEARLMRLLAAIMT